MIALLVLAAGVSVEQYDPEKPVSKSDYEGRTLRELTLLRNVTYARAHNPFRRKWLNAWFSQQKWYSAAEAMDESSITDAARANADAIGTYEASLTSDELLKRRDAARAAKPSPERVSQRASPVMARSLSTHTRGAATASSVRPASCRLVRGFESATSRV